MFKRSIIQLLCVALAAMPVYPVHAEPMHSGGAVDVQTLQALYPQATVIQVAPDQYPELARDLRRAGYRPHSDAQPLLLAAAEPDAATTAPQTQPPSHPQPQAGGSVDCNERSASPSGSGGGSNVGIDVNIFGGRHSGGRGSSDGAAAILVIIGAVVLVVWTVYALKYVADAATGASDPCSRRWSEWALTTTAINSYRPQYAYFTGLRYLSGVDHAGLNFGLSAELGHADVLLAEASLLRMQGLYWMVGPLLRWGLSSGANPSYLQMELLAGSTENKEMGVIATAKVGFNFGLTDRLRLGLSYGAMNINLHEQGIILDRSQFYTLWGLDMGYRF
jgi:hypothetical protein